MGRLAARPTDFEQLPNILKYSKIFIRGETVTPDTDFVAQLPLGWGAISAIYFHFGRLVRLRMFSDYIRRPPRYNGFMGTGGNVLSLLLA